MAKYIRVSDINKENPQVYTGEEIADIVRGAAGWDWDGSHFICKKCGCAERDSKRFCGYCGSHNRK